MKYCSHCGNQLADEAVICPQCGCAAGGAVQNKSESNSVLCFRLSQRLSGWF